MTDRTDVMQRVLNLRELADSSQSEAEAMNAMKIADKMMRSYRIEEAELALAEGLGEISVDIVSVTGKRGQLSNGRNRHKVQTCIWTLENYCEVEVVIEENNRYHVIGDRPDVELFEYLVEVVKQSMDNEYTRWKRTQQAVGRGAKSSFQLAMGGRINARLRDLMDERRTERNDIMEAEAKLLNKPVEDIRVAVSNGDLKELRSNVSLVVVAAVEQKRTAVKAAFKDAYKNVRLGTASGFGYASNGSASAAGRSAGNNVNFSRPLGGSSKALLR